VISAWWLLPALALCSLAATLAARWALRRRPIAAGARGWIRAGDVVAQEDGGALRSGAEAYGSAVCVSAAPFVLVSWETDMRWESTVRPADFVVVARASPYRLWACRRRLRG
jgi:hypothetical protein